MYVSMFEHFFLSCLLSRAVGGDIFMLTTVSAEIQKWLAPSKYILGIMSYLFLQ